MVELAGLGYHLKELSNPNEKVALVRKVSSSNSLQEPSLYPPLYLSRNTNIPTVLLHPRTPGLPPLYNTRQNLPPTILYPNLLHPQIPDLRLPRRITGSSHRHHGLLPNNLPMLASFLRLEYVRRTWYLH